MDVHVSSANRVTAGFHLENDILRVKIGDDGTIRRLVDKTAGGREVLAEGERGNQLWAFVDKPRTYDAWDIEENYATEGEEIGDVEAAAIADLFMR